MSTKDQSDSTNLEEHVVLLLDGLEPVADRVDELQQQFDATLDFFCYYESRTGHGGPEFHPETLSRVGRMGAKLGLDIYGPYDSSD